MQRTSSTARMWTSKHDWGASIIGTAASRPDNREAYFSLRTRYGSNGALPEDCNPSPVGADTLTRKHARVAGSRHWQPVQSAESLPVFSAAGAKTSTFGTWWTLDRSSARAEHPSDIELGISAQEHDSTKVAATCPAKSMTAFEIIDCFVVMDHNRDGKVSEAEFNKALKSSRTRSWRRSLAWTGLLMKIQCFHCRRMISFSSK
jgi:hypothetical protein